MSRATLLSQAQVEKWTATAASANESVQAARLMLGTGRTTMGGRSVDDFLMGAQETTETLRFSLRQACGGATLDAPSPIPLDKLDTPYTRHLLAQLEAAQDTAELLDASRGRALPPDTPLGPGESRGTDLAEAISVLCLRLRTEVYGPSGGGRE
jgi:hypothetical protein